MTAPGRVRGVAWLLPTLAMGFLTWTSFLYLGLRTRHRPFLYWAAGYLFVIGVSVGLTSDEDNGGLRSALSTVCLLGVWCGGFVHALVVHQSYAAWRARPQVAQLTPQWPAPPQGGVPQLGLPEPHWFGPAQQPGRPVPTWGHPPAVPPSAPPPPRPAPPQPPLPMVPLDLNTATVAELAAVPAVGPVLARRLVAERTTRGGFTSVEELLTLGFAPHVVASLRRHVQLPPSQPPVTGPPAGPVDPPHRGRGRVLDV